MSEIRIEDFIADLYARHGAGLAERLAAVGDHNVRSRARHGLSGGSTGNADCGFLYLLVKAFRRTSVFEIGTYVGTSAVAMTMAGASVHSCDPTAYGGLPPEIHFLNMNDQTAARHLRSAGIQVDMVFADWIPAVETIVALDTLGSDDLIFTAHDYLPGDKGVIAVERVRQHYSRNREGTWLLPPPEPVLVAPGLPIAASTAVLIPTRLLKAEGYL